MGATKIGSRRRQVPPGRSRTGIISFSGGLNLKDAHIALQPGELIAGKNYEVNTRGHYTRIEGYERFDGQQSPYESSYWYVAFDAGEQTAAVGESLHQYTSNATGTILAVPAVDTGTYAGNDATGHVAIRLTSGTFADNQPMGVVDDDVITNGFFSTDSDWTKGTGWTIGSGVATAAAGSASLLEQAVTVTVGKRYLVSFTILNYSAGTIKIDDDANIFNGETTTSRSANGVYREVLTCQQTGNFALQKDATFAGDIDGVTVWPILADADGAAVENGALTDALDDAYKVLVQTSYRNDIAAVTGSGSILGVQVFNGDVYAFRNNAGATAAQMWKATTSGWTLQSLGRQMNYKQGGNGASLSQAQIRDGDEIHGATSGASAICGRVIQNEGDWFALELITNGGFDQDSNWTKGTGWTIEDGVAKGAAGSVSLLEQPVGARKNLKYRVTFTVRNRTAGAVKIDDNEGIFNGETTTSRSTNGTFQQILTCQEDGSNFNIEKDASFVGEIDDVRCERLNDAAGQFSFSTVTSGPFTSGENLQIYLLHFDNGSIEIEKDDVVTGATSTESGTVTDVWVIEGSWSSGDARGVLRLKAGSWPGNYTDDENLQVGGTTHATVDGPDMPLLTTFAVADGADTATALSPNGRYEFVVYNFLGADENERMYGVNGVGPAFEWDGSLFSFIPTNMETDTPIHIAAHKYHLFLAFPNGSVQHSAIGDPLSFSVILGAGEIATGDEITGFSVEVGDVLAIFNRNDTYVLYGTSAADWVLKKLHTGTGAIQWTVQQMASTWYFDDRGITTLSAVEAFGDFQSATVTEKIQPIIDAKKTLVVASLRVRAKNQYRVFFSDNTGLIITAVNNQLLGIVPFEYDKVATVTCSAEDTNGNEVLYMGSDDGFVYQLDKGTSFDGGSIEAFIQTPYHHYQTPLHKKIFRHAQFEVDGDAIITVHFIPDFTYGDAEKNPPSEEYLNTITGGGALWDLENWNEFFWSAPVVQSGRNRIDGVGRNMSLIFWSDDAQSEPHTLQGALIEFSHRARVR